MATKGKGQGQKTPPETGAKKVQFEFEAPGANQVAVTGTFCGWDDSYPLRREKDGQWKGSMSLRPGRYEYRFIVDGEWREDPASSDNVPNPYGGVNSVLDVG